MLNSKIRPRAVVGYGVKIFHPSPLNYVTRSPGECYMHVINLIVIIMTMYTLSVFRAKTLKESVDFNNHGFCRPFSVLHEMLLFFLTITLYICYSPNTVTAVVCVWWKANHYCGYWVATEVKPPGSLGHSIAHPK